MELTHFNEKGLPRMVDVSEKEDTKRRATAACTIHMKKETADKRKEGSIAKGDVLSVAQVAGIMAAKNTSQNIPMCHNILITGVDLDFEFHDQSIEIFASADTTGK